MLDTADPPPVTEPEPTTPVPAAPVEPATTRDAGMDNEGQQATVTPAAPDRAATLDAAPVLPISVRICIFLVAAAAAILSFSSLRDLAVQTEYLSRIAWLFPISLDAAAGVAMVVWMRSPDMRVAKHARNLTWASIVLSVVCNGVQHGLAAAGLPMFWQVAVGVSTIPPVMFGAVVHLVVLTGGRHRWGGPNRVDTPKTPAPRHAAPDPVRDEPPVELPEPVTEPDAPDEADEDDEPSQAPVTAELRSVPSLPRDDDPSSDSDEQRRCANPACQKLLPRDSHPSRKTCGSPCRQAVARNKKQEVSA